MPPPGDPLGQRAWTKHRPPLFGRKGMNRTMLGDLESTFKVSETEAPQEPVIEPEEPEETGFAPEEPAPVIEPEAVPKENPEDHTRREAALLAATLDEREKRRDAQKERDELKAQLAQLRQQQAGEAPSIYDDPVAYQENLQAQLRAQAFAVREEMSDRFATQTHGADAVKAAEEWGLTVAKSDPTFSARYLAQSDPKGWLIAEHKRDLIAQDPDAFARKWAEDNGYVASQAPAVPAPTVQSVARPAAPPRSIASAPSSSGATHTPITSVMEAVRFNLG